MNAMVKLTPLVLSLSLLSVNTRATQRREILSNDDVIRLVQAKLSVQTILQEIEGTECSFSITAKDLIELRKAGVPDEILQLLAYKHFYPGVQGTSERKGGAGGETPGRSAHGVAWCR